MTREATAYERLRPVLPHGAGLTSDGALTIGGCDVRELAARFGTPLYVYDEGGLRAQARRFVGGMRERWPRSEVLFASKSFPAVAMYRLAFEEGLGVDVAGYGELRFALAAGVPAERIHVHGNAKTDAELRLAVESGVGMVVVDGPDDVVRLAALGRAGCLGSRGLDVLVRVIPAVDPTTHASQSTGGSGSKFGIPLGQLPALVERIESVSTLRMRGVHLHIGSQVFEPESFAEAVRAVGAAGSFPVYDVGGGYGVRYTLEEPEVPLEAFLDAVTDAARTVLPGEATLSIEPGRSLVARAGVILYTVTTVKRTGHTFVAVDGGIGDYPDIAMTGQRCEALVADRAGDPLGEPVHLVGRQCESGDLIRADYPMADPRVGDLVTMTTAGAYGYTLANTYNGAVRPAVVFCTDGRAREVVRRETVESQLALQHLP
ncbi:Diaminopimelate decarboxylase [Nostocoides japonicum T1-X7]|uniref:Diaminopimelate decarboxylase n=1 Tax=Nostocoides japonicum T1-X7 TaxID=1194083 RepID=A0A077M146_9MICO|nr:diaminopimelate decarboxylase [Tetrasphaera japonica]CCH78797.1 Diaminopimelate decarboxylase [Tetrasphaera japonica T1-X7]